MILLLIQEQDLSKHLSLDIFRPKPLIKLDFAIHANGQVTVYVSHIKYTDGILANSLCLLDLLYNGTKNRLMASPADAGR